MQANVGSAMTTDVQIATTFLLLRQFAPGVGHKSLSVWDKVDFVVSVFSQKREVRRRLLRGTREHSVNEFCGWFIPMHGDVVENEIRGDEDAVVGGNPDISRTGKKRSRSLSLGTEVAPVKAHHHNGCPCTRPKTF